MAASDGSARIPPVPSLPLPRFLESAQERREHAKKLAEVVGQVDGDVREEKRRHHADPADALTLRGLPAVGRSVLGVMRGTQPESALMSRQPRE